MKDIKKNEEIVDIYLEALEKGELTQAAKGASLALGLTMGAHYMGQDAKDVAAQKFAQNDIPKHARVMASVDSGQEEAKQEVADKAKREVNNIIYRNDKNWFLKKYSNGLSPHVYKQTIKQNPELTDKYGYINDLTNNTFKELIQKNKHLKDDVHSAHYDKLHNEFGGDHEKILHAWKNGIKATKTKFRNPANIKEPQLGQQPTQDIIDETVNEAPPTSSAPNFTHRRAFKR